MREKWIVIAAVFIVGVLSTHSFVIEPYQQNFSRVTDAIDQAAIDLLWMQSEVKRLPDSSSTQTTLHVNGSLANLINQAVSRQ